MTWTEESWSAFCVLLEDWWPGELAESSVRSWRVALDGIDPDSASEGLKRMLFENRKFRPSASELLSTIRSEPERPTFDEAYPTIYRAAAKQQLPEAHPLILGFIERQGLARLGALPLDHPDHGELVRKDLRASWEQHVESFDGRAIAAIASGSGEPRKLNPAAHIVEITHGQPQIEGET